MTREEWQNIYPPAERDYPIGSGRIQEVFKDWQEEAEALQGEIHSYLVEVAAITSALNVVVGENARIKKEIEKLKTEPIPERQHISWR